MSFGAGTRAARGVRVSLVLALGLGLGVLAVPAAARPRTAGPSAECLLALDGDGQTAYARNADVEHAPASLVKLMTLYVAFDALASRAVARDDTVVVTRHAAETPKFRLGLRAGERVPLWTLLEAVAIASANDAAAAVAEHVAGSASAFVERMNAQAQALGLAATRFANPHGLPDRGQHTTARDIAVLTTRLLADHPGAEALLAGRAVTHRGRVYARRLALLETPGGVTAIKTGYTNEAGFNLAVASTRGGRRVVTVVLGAPTRSLSFADARWLLRRGFGDSAGREHASALRRRPAREARQAVGSATSRARVASTLARGAAAPPRL